MKYRKIPPFRIGAFVGLGFAVSLTCAATPEAFLTIPNGARETAMGETGVSHARGGSAVWWNPALIALDGNKLEFQVFNWLLDGQGAFGAGGFRTSWGGIGGYYFNLNLDDFEIRDRPGPAQGSFTVHHSVLALGSSIKISDAINAGLNWKCFYEKLYSSQYSGSGLLDLGIAARWRNWRAGGVLTNYELWDYFKEELPLTTRLGIAYGEDRGQIVWNASLEGVDVKGTDYFHLGIECGWLQTVFLRLGYMQGHSSRDLTYGLGLAKGRYRADLALTPYDYGLGTVWRASIGVGL